ncbi:MAG TPA: AMP-binding protein [Acidimicrobiales bacterium]|nr:AMP-binding protein [Acidimicrobiales bacterium]
MEHLRIGEVVSVTTGRAPRRIAASMGDRRVTYAELDAATEQLVRALSKRGVEAGHRVVWRGETSLDAIALWFALAKLGAVCVPLNPRFTSEEAGPMLDVADPALVVDDGIHAGPGAGDATRVELAELLALSATTGVSPPHIDENQTHVIFFTSGSSGRPKGVELSHRASRLRILGDASMWPSGAVVCMFPQFHMAGWFTPMTVWASADEVVYVERAEADALLAAVHERRAVRLYAIPAVWRRILEADRSPYDVSCLRYCDTGTSSATPELLSAMADAFPGTQTSITYGSTEAGGVCRLWPQDIHRKPGSVGPPALGCEVRLSEDGELLVRNPVLMNGYFRDPEATAAALVDGWFHTGDLAERDEEGYYSIVGRAREVIRSGGETVAPVEVDDVVLTIPGVVDAGVAGVPDDDWGEVVTAFVVLQPGRSLDLATVRRHCEGRLASYKHPRRLVVVDALPRTGATHQIQRRVLVEWAQAGGPAAPRTAG